MSQHTQQTTRPPEPIPAPLRGEDVGTFAHFTVAERMPGIGARVLSENDWPAQARADLEQFLNEFPQAQVQPLQHPAEYQAQGWAEYLQPYQGMSWFQIPWFFGENYFFRTLLDRSGYFRPGPTEGQDPYRYQKDQGLHGDLPALRRLVNSFTELPDDPVEGLALALQHDLWGNQADLSLWPVGSDERPEHAELQQRQDHLLVDDSRAVARYLLSRQDGAVRVDLLMDNAGQELAADLCLVDYLLQRGPVDEVRLHLKAHPTFVSDAMEKDVLAALDFFVEEEDADVRSLGRRLRTSLEGGRLVLRTHPYWTSPLMGWEMPADVRQELAQADLLISKGDAQYRRLLGDRYWPYTMPMAEILRYLPAPLAALRVLKSEVAAGLPAERIEQLEESGQDWLTNGKWAVIQFVDPQA